MNDLIYFHLNSHLNSLDTNRQISKIKHVEFLFLEYSIDYFKITLKLGVFFFYISKESNAKILKQNIVVQLLYKYTI